MTQTPAFQPFEIGDWTVTGREPVYGLGYAVDWLFYLWNSGIPPGPRQKYRLENKRTGAVRSVTLDSDRKPDDLAEMVAFIDREAGARG